jgi:hypothetical protein
MKTLKNVCTAGVLLATFLLTGCASYQAASLSNLSPEFLPNTTQKDVTITCKVFNKVDCKKYLDRDVISEGYQPVQIAIQNQSNKTLIFSSGGISIPHVSSDQVAPKVHTSTAGRIAAYGVGSIFIPFLVIPAVVDGIKSASANDHLDIDFAAKEAKDQILYPQSKLNGLIFVPQENYSDNLTVTLIDKDTNEANILTVEIAK